MGKDFYGFNVFGYQKDHDLIIAPVILVYSTNFGGSGGDVGKDIAVDHAGHVYVTGTTRSSDFPTLNPFQTDPGDNY